MVSPDDAVVLVLLCLAWIAISKYEVSEAPGKRLFLVAAGYLLCRVGSCMVNTSGPYVSSFVLGIVLIFLGSSAVVLWALSGSAFLLVLAFRSLLCRRAIPPLMRRAWGMGWSCIGDLPP
jgi:hypothetical protein